MPQNYNLEKLYALLKKLVSEIDRCPLCHEYVYILNEWVNGHIPYLEVTNDGVRLGFYCGRKNPQRPIIIAKIERREKHKENHTRIF